MSETSKLLDTAGKSYLKQINGSSNKVDEKMQPFIEKIPFGKKTISVGVGNGDEIRSIKRQRRDLDVVGVDLSFVACKEANPETVYQVDAINMPFAKDTFGGVVMSAILHEVYSYAEHANSSWYKAVSEAIRVLEPGGILYVRDPYPPEHNIDILVKPKNKTATRFMDYFRENFRRGRVSFFGYDTETFKAIDTAELIMHYRNFLLDYSKGLVDFEDKNWKELNEYYFPRDLDYVNDIINIAQHQGINVSTSLNIASRDETVLLLDQQFELQHDSFTSKQIIEMCTRKMELLITKEAK